MGVQNKSALLKEANLFFVGGITALTAPVETVGVAFV
jgi:hypothetical protein